MSNKGKGKKVDDGKQKEVQKRGSWIPVTPAKPILERLRPRQKNEDSKRNAKKRGRSDFSCMSNKGKAKKVDLGDDEKRKEVQKQGSWIPVTPEKPILERLRPRRRNEDSKHNAKKRGRRDFSYMSNKGKAKILYLGDDGKRKKVQKQGSWIPVTPEKPILERLRPRRRNEDSKRNAKKRGRSGIQLNGPHQGLIGRKKHSKPKVLFEGPATPKRASIKENLFGKGKNAVNNSFINNALASSSNEVIGEAIVPNTPEPASRRFEHNNLCATNQTGCREYSLRVYQRIPQGVKQKLGPNSPKIRGGQKATLHRSLLSVITADDREKGGGEYVEEEEDKYEEKWWKKEREVFHRRIHTFNAHMRCIQGNRYFSPWKGSVVDSIIGAFLTQNVMDNLSSSAFMSLAARYQNTEMQQANSMDCQDKQEQIVNESNLKEEISSYGLTVNETKRKRAMLRRKKGKYQKKKTVNWDSLRRAYSSGRGLERNANNMDSVNWQAVRFAKPEDVSAAIFTRGMSNNLTERIQDFLDRQVRELKSIDLEWLRNVPPEKAKEFLMDIRGLGLKSSECVRLLTLKQLAFPVDTNVGRIAVRLGWVPLQPLPQNVPLHLLDEYPKMDDIHKYLWPRLCTLDQGTLYELHYQMITFGKVFCTKRRPNCNACPLKAECKYFVSAFARARLALPGQRKKSRWSSIVPVGAAENPAVVINPTSSSLTEANPFFEVPERDMEDFYYKDPNEIPLMQFKMEEFTENLRNYMDENNLLPEEGDISKALVSLTLKDANIPMPKLKYATRLRTEHQVYELPKSHPLLTELDKRDPDDPCPYLLAIWTPGEQCDEKRSFSCNNTREQDSQTVLGTILIPCRTAMRGSFPLNGTYFQVNEVFADDESSQTPITLPMSCIWCLPRRTLYCGTSTSVICKGLPTEKIQHCFWRGYICLRGFNRKTRAPRPLAKRFHLQASETRNAETNRGSIR